MLVWSIEGEVIDATLALNMFEQAQAQQASFSCEERRARWDRCGEIWRRFETDRGVPWDDEGARDRVKIDAEIALLGEILAQGKLPNAMADRLPFIHSKSFLFSLDAMRKSFITAQRFAIAKAPAETAVAALQAALPNLAGVRDSTAHADERAIGKAGKRTIIPQPINNGVICAPNGGAAIGASLIGDRFGSTLRDGTFGEVEVNEGTLRAAHNVAQSFIDALPWREPRMPKISPSA